MLNKLFIGARLYLLRFLQDRLRPSIIFHTDKKKKFYSARISTSAAIEHSDRLTLGKNVFIGHHAFIDATNSIEIEEGCQIAHHATILTHSTHDSVRLYGDAFHNNTNAKTTLKASVKIGAYSFIGSYSLLMPATVLGKGCLVYAYSYVDGTFPDYSILSGKPAKIIGNTRERDDNLIRQFPELKELYNSWNSNN